MEPNYPVTVSIFVPTFNHEQYITRALDSILMQKTGYSYEVLVGEDASTDNTRAVLQAYEAAHPGKLTVFYREENMYHAPVSNSMDLKLRCKGKYIIALEGDDFWTDENKLETQVRFLEEHPDYIAVAHRCTVVGADSQPNGEVYPQCPDEEYTFRHFFDRIMPGQFTTLLSRNYMLPEAMDNSLLFHGLTPGDQLIFFTLLCHGKIRCLPQSMSAYRHITTGGTSYSANVRFRYDEECRWNKTLLEYARLHCTKKVIRMAESLYLGGVITGLRRKCVNASQAKQDCRCLKHPVSALWVWFCRTVRFRLTGRKAF